MNKIIQYEDKIGLNDILSKGPVLAKVYTECCSACKILDTKIKELLDVRPDIKIINIDGQKNPIIINWLSIRNVPKLFIIFSDGVVDNFVEYNENLVTCSIDDIIKFYDELKNDSRVKVENDIDFKIG